MLRIGICDDEQIICTMIEKALGVISSNMLVEVDIEMFSSGEELFSYLDNGANLDMIFLDIMMKGINGIQIGKIIRDEMHNELTKIIYISGKESYAMELFDVRPLNFLIKPIKLRKLEEVFGKAVSLIDKENEFFEYQISNVVYKAPIREILYFESKGKKVKMVMMNDRVEFYRKLSDVYKQIGNQNFFFIHKSFLVNYEHIIQYHYEFMMMSDKVILPISKKNRSAARVRVIRLKEMEVLHGI